MNQENILNNIYSLAINGQGSYIESVNKLAEEYLSRYGRTDKAIDRLVSNQRLKCTATGFLTGLGGIMTLPVTIPTDLASSLLIEIRMIAAIASIRGYDIKSDDVRTMVYLCLVGNAVGDVLKQVGIKALTQYTAKALMPKITKAVIGKINRAVGFKLLAKGGSKGLINVGKAVPIVGGVVGGAYNYAEVSAYAKLAKSRFN